MYNGSSAKYILRVSAINSVVKDLSDTDKQLEFSGHSLEKFCTFV